MTTEDLIHRFLDKEVPYTGTSAWNDWQDECNRLGATAPQVFIEMIRTGPEHTHYPAVLGLRIFGFEAFGFGDGPNRIYKVKAPGAADFEVINPISKPPDYDDPDTWTKIAEGK